MRWLFTGSLLALAALALALALAGGTAGEEGNATEEALLLWTPPPGPLLEGVWNSTYIYGYFVNNWTTNISIELNAWAGTGFELIPRRHTTFELSPANDNLSYYFDYFFFYLNVSAGTLAPVNATVTLAFEITAWEGNISPDPRWYNRTIDIRYESWQPPLEITLLNATARIDVSQHNRRSGCIDYQIYNPGSVLISGVNVHFVGSPHGNPNTMMSFAPGGTQKRTACFTAPSGTPAGSHQARIVAEVTDSKGEASYLSATRNFTVEVLPYSQPRLEWQPFVDLIQNRRFRLPVNITNNGNAADELYVTLANYDVLKRDGFRFDPLPGPVALAPGAAIDAYISGSAPDLFYDEEYYEFEIVVNGSYAGTNATLTQNVRVAIIPDLPAPPLGAAVLVLVAMASGLRARRDGG